MAWLLTDLRYGKAGFSSPPDRRDDSRGARWPRLAQYLLAHRCCLQQFTLYETAFISSRTSQPSC